MRRQKVQNTERTTCVGVSEENTVGMFEVHREWKWYVGGIQRQRGQLTGIEDSLFCVGGLGEANHILFGDVMNNPFRTMIIIHIRLD